MSTNNKVMKFLKNYNYAWKFKLQVCLPLFLVLIAIDWISKGVVQATMTQGQDAIGFIPGFLNFQFIINPGSAYGFNANNLALAVSLATIMTILLIVVFIFANGKHWLAGLTIVLAGSFANLLARSWAPAVNNLNTPELNGIKGGVIDFLHWDFTIFGSDNYVFNFADLWVILGVVAMVLGVIIELIISTVKKSNEAKRIEQSAIIEEAIVETNLEPEPFNYKDESKLSGEELKKYKKELKAYEKMEKMKVNKDEKKTRKPRK